MRHLTFGLAAILVSVTASAQTTDTMQTHVLDEIVFEALKAEGDTLQNFYKANASSTTETILSRMKGISLVRRGAFGQEPVFRSLKGGQLNVTLDGMKLFGACTDKMDPVTIYVEPQNLSVFETMPATDGAGFGSTFGGTLNMKLAEPVVGQKKTSGKAGADFQSSASAFNYFAHVNLSGSQSAYRVSGTYRKSGNYKAGGGEEIPFSQYEKINISVAGKWATGKADTLQASALLDRGWNIGFPALPMDVGMATAGIFSATWNRVAPLLFFHHFRLKAYHNTISHEMDDSHRKDVLIHMDMPGSSRTTGAFADGEVHLFHGHRTYVKAEYFAHRNLGEMTMYPTEGPSMYMQTAPASQRQDYGVFASQKFRINDKFRGSFSLRGDLVRDYVEPGIGRQQWEVFEASMTSTTSYFIKTISSSLRYKIKNNVSLEARAGYGERAPTLNERYGYYLFDRFDGYDYIGNPQLKAEGAWNADVTFNYFGEKVELEVTPYVQNIRNYIFGAARNMTPMTIGARGSKQYENDADARLHGVDVMVLARPVAALQCVANIKYSYGEMSGGHPMPLIPPFKSVVSARYDLKKVHVQAEWEFAARQTRVNHETGEQPTPGWHVLALRTGWQINAFLKCNAGIENLLDSKYREHLDWGGIPRPGRNFYFTAIVQF